MNKEDFFLDLYLKGFLEIDFLNGAVYNPITCRPIGAINNYGYCFIGQYFEGKRYLIYVHRYIWIAYHQKLIPSTLQINHIDGNKLNNCIYNLELVTSRENNIHALETKLRIPKKNYIARNAKCTEEQIREIFRLRKENPAFYTHARLAEMFGTYRTTITSILSRKLYSSVVL